MKSISRILSAALFCAPICALAAGPVATTSGSNLTAFNPSNSYNNQWATMTNGRYDGNTTAKVDFGNCNAVVLRCAQPKCANGGCADMNIASSIVAGCVQSNNSCKQYGDDLINYMAAQLVASSNAKINEQNVAAANAAAAAAQSAQLEQQQMQQMQSEMQNQMYQMQQQMAQQQAESAAQLQAALAQQAAQSQAALDDMRAAATAAATQNEAGVSSYQQDAIDRGVSLDVLERQKITGQIMTEIENAETSLATVKKVMNDAFNYARCDMRGNNCEGPRRVKRWRELADNFVEPYDNTIDKIYDALMLAQTVGVDLSQIYLMLNNSCNSWGQYLCPSGTVKYSTDDKSAPEVCATDKEGKIIDETCQKCRLLKLLTKQEDVYQGWIDAEDRTSNNSTIVACASGALNSSIFERRAKRRNGSDVIDIEVLGTWLHQIEPSYKLSNETTEQIMRNYCAVDDNTQKVLETAVLSKNIDVNKLCVASLGGANHDETCPYISATYAICDAHPYNANIAKVGAGSSLTDDVNKTKTIVGLKTTVVSQQMYKQYEYLSATLRRLKTQLERAVLTANLEAAGAQNNSGTSSLIGANSNEDKTIYLAGAENCWNSLTPEKAYSCIQSNLNIIKSNVSTNKKKSAQQLAQAVAVATSWGICETKVEANGASSYTCGNCTKFADKNLSQNVNDITDCANSLNIAVARRTAEEQREQNRYPNQRY